MCIIISKSAGIDVPTREILDNCIVSNPHGIGFSYALKGQDPTISKGFMTVDALEQNMQESGVSKDHNLIIHFRYATHGEKIPENCHPFPLTADFKEMQYLRCTCQCAIAHNGVFSDMPASDKYSDSMKFIGGVLASPYIIQGLHTKPVRELIKGYCGWGSKLAFLTKTGISLIGTWNIDEGIHYSNYCHVGYNSSCQTTVVKKWKNRFDDKKDQYLCHFCKEMKVCFWDRDYKGMLCKECTTQLAEYSKGEN